MKSATTDCISIWPLPPSQPAVSRKAATCSSGTTRYPSRKPGYSTLLNDPVKHALVAIQALERGQRAAVVAELAVVIVLDDPGPLLTFPVQQGQTPWQRQRDTERALMGRRHHGKTRIGRPAQPRFHAQAVVVDRHGHEPHPRVLEHAAGVNITGILEPAGVAGRSKVRQIRSSAPRYPAVMKICPAEQSMPRDTPRYADSARLARHALVAARSPATGSPSPARDGR